MGRSLKTSLYNLEINDMVTDILKKWDVNIDRIYDYEPDAGLGNGGLGRLAACYLDGLATDGYPAMGYSICYEYGIFKQKIVDGWQTELPDNWLPRRRELGSFPGTRSGYRGSLRWSRFNEYWEQQLPPRFRARQLQHSKCCSLRYVCFRLRQRGRFQAPDCGSAKAPSFDMDMFNQRRLR